MCLSVGILIERRLGLQEAQDQLLRSPLQSGSAGSAPQPSFDDCGGQSLNRRQFAVTNALTPEAPNRPMRYIGGVDVNAFR
jgi:hypothetical protein